MTWRLWVTVPPMRPAAPVPPSRACAPCGSTATGAGMAITIEPGLYLVPDSRRSGAYRLAGDRLQRDPWAALPRRGIRIEDDVLVTSDGHEVLTAAIRKGVSAIRERDGQAHQPVARGT